MNKFHELISNTNILRQKQNFNIIKIEISWGHYVLHFKNINFIQHENYHEL